MYHLPPQSRRDFRLWDRALEYEVWAYSDLGTEETCIYLFSYENGIGNFKLVQGVESVLPGPNMLLHKMYYAELASFEKYFRDRYQRIEDIWFTSPTSREVHMRLKGQYYDNKREDAFNPTHHFAVAQKSQVADSVGRIRIFKNTFRFLNENNQPRLSIVVSSSPQLRIKNVPDLSNELHEMLFYNLKHTLIIRNQDLDEVYRNSEILETDIDKTATYILNHDDQKQYCTIGVEATDTGNSKDIISNKKALLSLGSLFFTLDRPLQMNPDSLEISDLIMGMRIEPFSVSQQYRFPVFPVDRLNQSEYLHIYIEIYHLKLDDIGIANYMLEYGIKGIDQNEGDIEFAYSRNTKNHKSPENFALDISKLQPGQYEFFIRIKDQLTGQGKSRSGKFTVLE
jgi:hypothetical protein